MKKINPITGNTEYTLLENTEFVSKVLSEDERNLKFEFNHSTKILTILSKTSGGVKMEYILS